MKSARKIERAFEAAAKRDQAALQSTPKADAAALEMRLAEFRERKLREYAEELDSAISGVKKTEPTAIGSMMPDAEKEFAALFAKFTPRTDAEVRGWNLRNEVLPRVKDWGFEERYLREILDFKNEAQAATAEVCRQRLQGVGAVVAMIGIRGAGKTTIAAQLAIEKAWSVHRARECGGPGATDVFLYRKVTGLVRTFKPLFANFGAIDSEALSRSLDFLCGAEFLVIDEMHDLSELAVREALLIDVIDRRYAGLRDTVLISNQTPEEWEAQTPDSIQSRIAEHGCVLRCEWESWRGKRG